MLMDLFHNSLEPSVSRRTHFHAFMEDVHRRIRRIKEEDMEGEEGEKRTARQIIEDSRKGGRRGGGGGDPIRRVGAEMSVETKVLCFDEVSDATAKAS